MHIDLFDKLLRESIKTKPMTVTTHISAFRQPYPYLMNVYKKCVGVVKNICFLPRNIPREEEHLINIATVKLCCWGLEEYIEWLGKTFFFVALSCFLNFLIFPIICLCF